MKDLSSQVYSLSPAKVKELESTLFDASIARGLGCDFKEVFRRAAIGRIDRLGRIYRALSRANAEDIDRMADTLMEGLRQSNT